jgi:hypothetical protein
MTDEQTPKLSRATFEFYQEPNCLKSRDETETLIIECESSLGIDNDEGCFFVLKTESWSLENVEELQSLFTRCVKSINHSLK